MTGNESARTAEPLDRRVLEALGRVQAPTGKSVADEGILVSIRSGGDILSLVFRDQNWPKPVRDRIGREARAAIQAMLPDVAQVDINWTGTGEQGLTIPETADGTIKHVIAVGSGKGGVGKSTLAAGIAYGLAIRGCSVGLMDADVYGPSIPHMLGITEQPEMEQGQEIRFYPPVRDGIKVISMGMLVPANQAVVWRGPMVHKAIRDFLYSVVWGNLDYLIVDLPPGTGDIVLTLSQQMPLAGGVIVCTPQDVALLDAKKALNMFATVKVPVLGIVENMSFFSCPHCGGRSDIFGHGGAKRWAEEVAVPYLGEVPINLGVRLAGDQGRFADNFVAGEPAREALLAIVDNLLISLAAGEPIAAPTIEFA